MKLENGNIKESATRRRWGGVRKQKPCCTLSFLAKVVIFLAILGLFLIFVNGLHPFLAVSDPVPGGILVIEGWVHDINIEQTAIKFSAAHDRDVFILSALHASGSEREWGREHSEYIAAKLKRSGVSPERVHLIFCEVSKKDRTYHTAVALKSWLQERGIPVDSLNVITMGAHARRSRLLFQKAFGDKVKVGVIPIDDPDHDSAHWWRSRDGVGQMIYQCFAYIYAKFFFHP
jgi:uncharacterized SAM-binding protein YcdF (DUF218 family)